MTEKELLREKEAEVLPTTQYDINRGNMKARISQAREGKKVIKAKNLPWEINRQGIIKYYSTEGFTGLTNDNWSIFSHEIRHHSGRHVHQGGRVLFVTKGKGYSTIDGEKYEWQAGDLITLPIKKGGVEHQHFNLEEKPSCWISFAHLPTKSAALGNFMEQKEEFSLWKERLAPCPQAPHVGPRV